MQIQSTMWSVGDAINAEKGAGNAVDGFGNGADIVDAAEDVAGVCAGYQGRLSAEEGLQVVRSETVVVFG